MHIVKCQNEYVTLGWVDVDMTVLLKWHGSEAPKEPFSDPAPTNPHTKPLGSTSELICGIQPHSTFKCNNLLL